MKTRLSQRKPASKEKSLLDLGLSSLVGGGTGPVGSRSMDRGVVERSSGGKDPHADSHLLGSDATESGKPSEYALLAASLNWKELSALCESRMGKQDAGEAQPTLWWILSQLELGAVPVNILAAPLDSATKQLAAGSDGPSRELIHLAETVLVRVSEALGKCGDYGTAIMLLERAFELNHTHGSRLLQMIEHELVALKAARMNKKSAFKIEGLTHLRDKILQEVDHQTPRRDAPRTPEITAVAETSPGRSRWVFQALAILLITLIALELYGKTVSSLISPRLMASVSIESSQRKPSPLAPKAERAAGLSHLDPIFYGISGAVRQGGAASSQQLSDSSNSASSAETPHAGQGEPVVEKAGSEQPNHNRPKRDTINTTGPLESDELREIRTGEKRRDDTSESSARLAIPDSSPPENKGEGGRTQALPVEKFPKPRAFSIISRTSIMARPSYYTVSIGALEEGDRVIAEAAMGEWLKLRSKEGEIGYILAQDARRIEERAP